MLDNLARRVDFPAQLARRVWHKPAVYRESPICVAAAGLSAVKGTEPSVSGGFLFIMERGEGWRIPILWLTGSVN